MEKGLLKTIYIAVTMLALVLSLSVSTYAWFTTNSVTETDLATGHSNTDQVKLLLSSSGPSDFSGASEASITQVNQSTATSLFPVTTRDLKNYLYNPSTVNDQATYFVTVENEKYIYHGRIYLKAESQGHVQGGKLALYLDEDDSNGGKLMKNVNGYILNSARLGLIVDGKETFILRFTDDRNPKEGYYDNTVVGGELLKSGYVLAKEDETIKAYADPSELYNKYVIPANGVSSGSVSALAYLELDRVYSIDIYFYLEGCDPDCSNITEFDSLDFHLGFYGVLTEEVN